MSALLPAQSPQATVSGTVTDSQNAIVPGVAVVAANTATNVTYRAVTNESGFYSLRALPIGAYRLTAAKDGFRRVVHDDLVLTTGQSLELDLRLEVGSLTETVSVVAETPLLETRTSDTSQLVEGRSVEDIPLGDRRTMNIVRLTGAAVFVNYDSGAKPNFSIAGGRTQSQNFYMDGGTIQNMRLGIGQLDTDPPVETVAEVKVLANSFAAEYGGSAGGVIVATTKSGTNKLHGAAYEYLRNEELDAANFFAPVVNGEKQRPPLRYNVFGATAGGPVIVPKLYNGKDRAFFYFAYEGSRRRDGFTDQFGVPTPEQRNGDFSKTLTAAGALVPIYDPKSTRVEGGRSMRDLFPGNIIPVARVDKVGAALMPLYPLPNRPPDNLTGANNYRANYVQGLTRDAYLVKGDITVTDKDRLSLRYLYNSDDRDYTTVMTNAAADTRGPALRHQNFFYGTYTRVFSPTVINEFRFTYGNRINHEMSFGLGESWPSKLGLKGVPENAFPQFNIPGFRALGNASQERRQYPIEQLQWIDNLSWTRGRNTFKFGAEFRPSYNYEENYPTVSGSFTTAVQATSMPGSATTGYGLASLLSGAVTGFSARQTEALNRESWYMAWFVQDDWQVRNNLTLNLGLRWETDTPIHDVLNRMNGFDMSATNPVSGTPGVVKFMGQNGFRTNPYDTDWNNFGPRAGFAWKPFLNGKTVVRGGSGFFFAHPFDRGAPTSASLGYEISAAINSPDNGITIPFYLQDGVPGYSPTKPPLNDSFGAVRVGQTPTTAVTFYEENRRTGYSMQWNLSIQREIGGTLIEAAYLANASRKLASANFPINQVRPEILSAASTQKDRPYPQFSNVTLVAPSFGVSNYHALAIKAERRFANGFSFFANYTWSKFLNNTDEGGSSLGAENTYSDGYNRRADYGPSENDIPQRVNVSGVYELPFGKGRRFATGKFADAMIGGWSLGGVFTIQSGPPFTVTTQVNTVYSAAGALRADVSRNPNLDAGSRTLYRWFDMEAFAQPAAAKFGNQGINILRADGITNLDLSMMKAWNLPGEGRKIQLRGEFFNAGNHPDFGLPGRTFGGPGFGLVSSARAGRSIQLGLRLVY